MDGAAGVLMVGQPGSCASGLVLVLVGSSVLVLVLVLLLVLVLVLVLLLVLVPEEQSSVIDLALMPSLLLSSHVTPRKCVAAVFQADRH